MSSFKAAAIFALFFAYPAFASITQLFPWCVYPGAKIAPCVAPASVVVQTSALVAGAPTVTKTGTGAQTWTYACTAVDLVGEGVAGAGTSITNAGTLDGSHVNHVTCPATAGATSCNIYITVAGAGGSTGLIDSGHACGATFDDSTGFGSGDPPAQDHTTGIYVSGGAHVVGRSAFGNSSSIDSNGLISLVIDDTIVTNEQFIAGLAVTLRAQSTSGNGGVTGYTGAVRIGGTDHYNSVLGNDFGGILSGSNTIDRFAGYDVSNDFSSFTGHIMELSGFSGGVDLDPGSTIDDGAGLRIRAAVPGGATFVNLAGVNIGDMTAGTNNWAIKTGLGKVAFGDRTFAPAFVGSGTTPAVSTCGTIGTGSTNAAGFINSATTGSCVSVLAFTATAPTGWSCAISNSTTANLIRQTGSSQTSATFTGATVSGDVLRYACTAY